MAFGPEPAHKYGQGEVDAAVAELAAEESAKAMLASCGIVTAAHLGNMVFAPINWAVPGLVAEGLSMLSGPPKAGKSWLSLGLLLAVATGGTALGRIDTVAGRCLYLSFEDHHRRLQDRLERLGSAFPRNLEILTALPKGKTLADFLGAYLLLNEDVKLIVVDTLGKGIRCDLNDYDKVQAVLEPLQRIALEKHVGILLIHHTKKGDREGGGDVFDSSLGSQGILGAMDGAMILERQRGEDKAVLHVVGRDVPDAAHALALDSATMAWTLTDESPAEIRTGPERRAIVDLLKASARPLKTGEIASAIGRSSSTASEHLKALFEAGIVAKSGYGAWLYRGSPSGVTESTETSESSRPAESETPPKVPKPPKVPATSTESLTFGDSVLSVKPSTFGDSALSVSSENLSIEESHKTPLEIW